MLYVFKNHEEGKYLEISRLFLRDDERIPEGSSCFSDSSVSLTASILAWVRTDLFLPDLFLHKFDKVLNLVSFSNMRRIVLRFGTLSHSGNWFRNC